MGKRIGISGNWRPGVWADVQIREWAEAGGVKPYLPHNVQPASIDLSVDNRVRLAATCAVDWPRPSDPTNFDPALLSCPLCRSNAAGASTAPPSPWQEETHFHRVMLHPGDSAVFCSIERVQIPTYAAAELRLKHSAAMMGLQLSYAGWGDPGFGLGNPSCWSFVLTNVVQVPVVVEVGATLVQMVVYGMSQPPAEAYDGHFQGQSTTAVDPDWKWIPWGEGGSRLFVNGQPITDQAPAPGVANTDAAVKEAFDSFQASYDRIRAKFPFSTGEKSLRVEVTNESVAAVHELSDKASDLDLGDTAHRVLRKRMPAWLAEHMELEDARQSVARLGIDVKSEFTSAETPSAELKRLGDDMRKAIESFQASAARFLSSRLAAAPAPSSAEADHLSSLTEQALWLAEYMEYMPKPTRPNLEGMSGGVVMASSETVVCPDYEIESTHTLYKKRGSAHTWLAFPFHESVPPLEVDQNAGVGWIRFRVGAGEDDGGIVIYLASADILYIPASNAFVRAASWACELLGCEVRDNGESGEVVFRGTPKEILPLIYRTDEDAEDE